MLPKGWEWLDELPENWEVSKDARAGNLPEDWKWLDELPETWAIPEEIRTPTRIPQHNLSIRMLSSQMIGNDVVVLLGTWLTKYAEFNMWGATKGKGVAAVSVRDLAFRVAESRDITRRIYVAWREYEVKMEATGRRFNSGQPEYDALVVSLRDGIEKLSQLYS